MFGYVDLVIFIGVLAAAAMILPSAMNWDHMAFSAQVAQIEAGQLATITDGALQYEYANSATLDLPGSSHSVTVAQLIAQGYLPSGTKATDSFGNQISVIFNADAAGTVTGYVVDQGPKVYTDKEAGQVLLALGDRGGYDPAELLPGQTPNRIYGSGGTWQAGAPAGVAPGSIEVEVEPNAAQEADDSRFLWRVPAPNAAGNTMSTPLIMSAVETPGAACSYTGAIAQDGTGALVSCQSGTWQSVGGGHWRAPVATYAALPNSGNQNGDVRLTLDTDRAFAWNGSSWVALAVDQNGNLTVPEQLTAENDQVRTSTSCSGQGSLTAGDITMTTDTGCGVSGSAIQMSSPVTGQGYAIVDSQDGSLNFWNQNENYSAMKIGPEGTVQSQTYPGTGNGGSNWVLNGANNQPNGWGFQPQYNQGWSMVTQDGIGELNVAPESALGSVDVNDIDVRSGGAYPWYSQLSNQVYSNTQAISNLQSTVAQQGNEINSNTGAIDTINSNLDNSNPCGGSPYASFQALCSEIQSAGGSYVGSFGPATATVTTQQVCGWEGPPWHRYWGCWTVTNTGPASASGTANGSTMWVDGTANGPWLADKPLLISVTGLVGSKNQGWGTVGANWGGLDTNCTGNGVGASILAYVNGVQAVDISLSKTGQPDYQTWVVTENTATFLVPAGQPFNIQSNNTCSQFRGVIWAL